MDWFLYDNDLRHVRVNEWTELNPDFRTLDSNAMFHKKLRTFVRSSEKSICNVYAPQRSKVLNRVRLDFSHLREHKFQHNFADAFSTFQNFKYFTNFFPRVTITDGGCK